MSKCRVCFKSIKKFMSFGKMPIANSFIKKNKFKKQYFYDMEAGFCKNCATFQLIKVPKAKLMFNEKYAYLASTSNFMKKHWSNLSKKIINNLKNNKNPFVVEIGSNDGIFLENIAKKKINHLGIDASQNVCEIAKSKGINSLNAFFNEKTARKIVAKYGKADVIVCTNTMHHIEDINGVVKGMSDLLKDKGTIITEDPSLKEMLNKNAYDQIYAEHMYIWSLSSINFLFGKYKMEVYDIENNRLHGGCSRYFIAKNNVKKITRKVQVHKILERKLKINKLSTYINFKNKVNSLKKELKSKLIQLKKRNKIIVGYGAPAKSTTILNFCNIDYKLIDRIFDNSNTKINKYTPGKSLIKIENSDKFKKTKSDYCVLFAWNHQKEILAKEKNYLKKNGKWIIPVPSLKVIK